MLKIKINHLICKEKTIRKVIKKFKIIDNVHLIEINEKYIEPLYDNKNLLLEIDKEIIKLNELSLIKMTYKITNCI
jgi:hypothetical protein